MEEIGNSQKKFIILISVVLGSTLLIAWSLISLYSSGGIQLQEEGFSPGELETPLNEDQGPAATTEPDVKEDSTPIKALPETRKGDVRR